MTLINRYPRLSALGLLIFWNFILVGYRVHLTGQKYFIFFLWNLLLAIIPYISSEIAIDFELKNKRNFAVVLLLLAILFLPNAPYIITDLFHLKQRAEMPFWYDTMVLFSVALSGLALFYATIFNIRNLLERIGGWKIAEAVVVFIGFLCSYGIYLGRYLRFNSWDVLANPNDLFGEMANHLVNPAVHTRTIGVTLLYGAFLLVGYWVIKLFQMGNNKILEEAQH